ncbi:MAG TPA: hypothetical protein VMT53_06215 [Terriglobales bacterium]|nr:hypothetical protein [Terriglobales bacterium]
MNGRAFCFATGIPHSELVILSEAKDLLFLTLGSHGVFSHTLDG